MEWQNIIALLTILGGWDAVKYLLNRKVNRKLEAAQADSADAQASADEFHTLREYNEFLQRQLQQKEERFTEQTDRLRKSQDNEFAQMKQIRDLQLELATKRCEVQHCGKRQPQNGY